MKDNYFKEFPKLLEDNNIKFDWGKKDTYGFTRSIILNIFGVNYYFEIFSNLINCYIGKKYANHIAITDLSVETWSCDNNRMLYCNDKKFSITLEPLDWQVKHLK